MLKLTSSVFCLAVTLFLTACATPLPVGILYTDVEYPIAATSHTPASSPKKGTATCKSYLGLIAVGEASVQKAAQDAGITKITHIDWDAENILGLYGVYTVTVYGE